MVPTTEFPPAIPLTSQATRLLSDPTTEAVNCWDCPTSNTTEVGDILTFTVRTVAALSAAKAATLNPRMASATKDNGEVFMHRM